MARNSYSSSSQRAEQVISVKLIRLRAKAQGFAFGTIAALSIFVATNWLILKDGEIVGPHLALLGNYFPGYSVTFMGSLIGACYAFAAGFIVGYVMASIYNSVVRSRQKSTG
jgi:hypothetical protein